MPRGVGRGSHDRKTRPRWDLWLVNSPFKGAKKWHKVAAFHHGLCHFACDFSPPRSSRMALDRHEHYAPRAAREQRPVCTAARTTGRVEFAGSERGRERESKVNQTNDPDLAVAAVASSWRDPTQSRTKIARRLRRTHEDSEECRPVSRAFFAIFHLPRILVNTA
jgi:hypothetical protein